MEFNFSEFEKEIIDSLKDSNLIERYSSTVNGQSPSQEVIMKYFQSPSLIFFDENGLFFLDEDDKVYCPELITSISDQGEWLSSKLPPINFDIDQAGNVRKADEVEAMYECTVVAHILNGSDYKEELFEFAKTYDFVKMFNDTGDVRTFRGLINEWQSLQSVVINVIISAAKFRISNRKKGLENFLREGLGEKDIVELRDLESKIRAINFTYSTGKLSSSNIKNLDKIKRLTLIDERDSLISELIVKSRVGNLRRALSLSSEYISPTKKKDIQRFINTEVSKLLKQDKYDNAIDMRDQLITKFRRRAYNMEITSIRRLAVERFIDNPQSFKLPPKL